MQNRIAAASVVAMGTRPPEDRELGCVSFRPRWWPVAMGTRPPEDREEQRHHVRTLASRKWQWELDPLKIER